ARAENGDALCDAAASAPDTCVISGSFAVADGTVLAFSKPNVDLRGSLTVQFAGQCSLAPGGPCASDADCVAPARCDRTGRLTLVAGGTLLVDGHGLL